MTEKEALRKFYNCADRNDLDGCLEALKALSPAVINEQCDDGYDMLISAVVSENQCAVEALLMDGRCDRTNRESLCGLTAEEFALNEPENNEIRIAFEESLPAQYIYRDGELIPREEIFHRIMTDELEADEGALSLLPLSTCAKLAKHNKISEDCWESAIEVRPELEELRRKANQASYERCKSNFASGLLRIRLTESLLPGTGSAPSLPGTGEILQCFCIKPAAGFKKLPAAEIAVPLFHFRTAPGGL